MATSKKLAEMKSLVGQAKKNIYRRIQLAAEVLSDRDWIDSVYSGDEGQAREELEAKYFPDLAKAYSMDQLLGMYRHFPERAWMQHGYHLHNLRALWMEETKAEDDGEERSRTKWKELATELEQKLEGSKRRLELLASSHEEQSRTVQSLREEIEKLGKENEQLRIENARLHGRIDELDAIVSRRERQVA